MSGKLRTGSRVVLLLLMIAAVVPASIGAGLSVSPRPFASWGDPRWKRMLHGGNWQFPAPWQPCTNNKGPYPLSWLFCCFSPGASLPFQLLYKNRRNYSELAFMLDAGHARLTGDYA